MGIRRSLLALLVGLAGAIGYRGGQDAPPGSELQRDGVEASRWAVRVFSSGDAGVSCYRIPAVVSTPNGTLVAFAEARHGGCADGGTREIAVRRSADGGRTWSAVGFAAGSRTNRVGNPYPIVLRSGRIVLVYVKHGAQDACGNGGCGSGNGVVFSDDGGATWTPEHDVSEQFGRARGALTGPGSGVALEVSPGHERLLAVAHRGAYIEDYVTYSDDGGTTWTTQERTFPRMDEGTFADLGGGHVLLSMRHTQEPRLGRALARSRDFGLTWSPVEFDRSLVGPVCQGSLMHLGSRVYHSNPASGSSRGRLTVRSSEDGGRSWTRAVLVQARASMGYSSLLRAPVGDNATGGILFEASRSGCVDFTTFPLDMDPSHAFRRAAAP